MNSKNVTVGEDNGAPPSKSSRRDFIRVAAATVSTASLSGGVALAAGGATDTFAKNDIVDVAIVGAGLAGLTAARDLQIAGSSSFIVLEASDRVGGRTLNHDLGHGYVSEAGGQWIGPGQTAVADLARELGVGTFPTYCEGKTVMLAGDGKVSADLHGGFGADPKLTKQLNALARLVPCGAPWKSPRAAELDVMSLGDWLREQNIAPVDRVGWDLASLLSGGTTPAKLGFLHYLSMINSADSDYERLDSIKDSAQGFRFVGGSQVLSLKMANAVRDRVRLSTPVRKISGWDQAIVRLETDRGAVRARQVIVALGPWLSNQIAFDPPLPPLRREMQRRWPAYSPARKVAHVYAKPFWREHGYNGQIIQADGPVLWAYDNSPPDGSIGVLTAFIAQSRVPSDREQANAVLMDVYARALGEEARRAVQFHDKDWGQAPWTLSCVSAIPPGFWTHYGKALHPPVGKLIWSGTETAEIWAGYMDGAVRSGHRAALQALQALGHDG